MISHLGLPRLDRTHESSQNFCLHGVTLFHLTCKTLLHYTMKHLTLLRYTCETLEVLT